MTKRPCETYHNPIHLSELAASVYQAMDSKPVNTCLCFDCWDNGDDEALAQYLYIGFKVADLHEAIAGHKLTKLSTFRMILRSDAIDEGGGRGMTVRPRSARITLSGRKQGAVADTSASGALGGLSPVLSGATLLSC
jgi:hypothetical protein